VKGFSASSIDIMFYVFFDTPDWTRELEARHRLALDILRLAHRLGVSFAFPTQTLHVVGNDRENAADDGFSGPAASVARSSEPG
jgi:MscS family membrane protein